MTGNGARSTPLKPGATPPPKGAKTTASGKTFITKQPAAELSADRFIGHTVTTAGGKIVGDIDDPILGASTGIEAAVIGVGGFLGIG